MDYFVYFLTEFKESFSASEGALIGIIIGAALTGIYNRSLKSIEYRNAYYQKLIDRRLVAYEEIEKAVLPFLKITYFDKETKVLTIFFENNSYIEIYEHFQSLKYKNVLLGPKSQKIFINLAINLDEIFRFLSQPQKEKDLGLLMVEMAEPINAGVCALLVQMENEYATLHLIEPWFVQFVRHVTSILKQHASSFFGAVQGWIRQRFP